MLIINRKKSKIDKTEMYQIIINDILMGSIGNEEIKKFDLKNGQYKMQLKSSNFHSKIVKFSITNGSLVEFSCKPKWKGTIISGLFTKVFKGNVGISLELTQDIYL